MAFSDKVKLNTFVDFSEADGGTKAAQDLTYFFKGLTQNREQLVKVLGPDIITTKPLSQGDKKVFDKVQGLSRFLTTPPGSPKSEIINPSNWMDSEQHGGLLWIVRSSSDALPNRDDLVEAIREKYYLNGLHTIRVEHGPSVPGKITAEKYNNTDIFKISPYLRKRDREVNLKLDTLLSKDEELFMNFVYQFEFDQTASSLVKELFANPLEARNEAIPVGSKRGVGYAQSQNIVPYRLLKPSDLNPLGFSGDVVKFTKLSRSAQREAYAFPLEEQTEEVIKKIISKFQPPKNAGVLTPEEVADVIIARRAIRIWKLTYDSIIDVSGEIDEAEFEFAQEKIDVAFETIRREISEDPDSSGLSAAQRQNLIQAIKRGMKIQPQCILINNILELAKANRKRLNAAFSNNQGDQIIDYKYTRMVSNPDNTAAIINKLTRIPGQEELLNLRTHQFARLFPYLRLYKVLTSTDKETKSQITTEVEFKFPNATNVQNTNPSMDIFENLQNPLTQEYGIKSFDWRFIGSDPFTYSNDIEATLVIHFNDFEQLVVERSQGGINGPKYRILDLLTISEKEREEIKNKDPDAKFDIRVDVGWSGPSDPSEMKAFDSDRSQLGFDAERSIRTLFLTMTDYDISFNEEGHFELTINYKSRLEQSLYDKKTNILIPEETAKSIIEEKQDELEDLRRTPDDANIESIREIESDLQQLRLASKQDAYGNIYRFLIQNNSIHTETISKTDFFSDTGISSFSTLEAPSNKNTLFSELDAKIDKLAESQRKQEEEDPSKKADYFPVKKSTSDDYLLNFFFLGDLVEALAQQCLAFDKRRLPSEQKFLDDTRIVLTDFLLYDPQDLTNKNVLSINIGDIPISVELFMSFYYEKVIKFNVGTYSLMKFVRDLISYCIINVFQECFGEENLKTNIKTGFMDFKKTKKIAKLTTRYGSGYSEDPFESYAKLNNVIGASRSSGRQVSVGKEKIQGEYYKYDKTKNLWSSLAKSYLDMGIGKNPEIASMDERKDCIHALIISSESFDLSQLKIDPNYKDKRKKDIESGLYHLDIGSPKGILKKINFKKTDQKYLREQRFTQDDASGFSILSNVFDVDISLLGNNLFFPGQRVFINLGERFSALGDPWGKGVDGNFANIMGLGGYHIVTSVENEISTSGFTTKINARWETSGDGKTKDVTTGAVLKLPASAFAPRVPGIAKKTEKIEDSLPGAPKNELLSSPLISNVDPRDR